MLLSVIMDGRVRRTVYATIYNIIINSTHSVLFRVQTLTDGSR